MYPPMRQYVALRWVSDSKTGPVLASGARTFPGPAGRPAPRVRRPCDTHGRDPRRRQASQRPPAGRSGQVGTARPRRWPWVTGWCV